MLLDPKSVSLLGLEATTNLAEHLIVILFFFLLHAARGTKNYILTFRFCQIFL